MKTTELQFIYVVLILPTLFGLTLVAEGLNKVLKDKKRGWFSLISGFVFIGLVVLGYFFFSQILK